MNTYLMVIKNIKKLQVKIDNFSIGSEGMVT